MKLGTTVFLLGCVVILVPFLGIPVWWQKAGLVGVGALLIIIGYIQRRQMFLKQLHETGGEHHTDTFVESTQSLFKKDT